MNAAVGWLIVIAAALWFGFVVYSLSGHFGSHWLM